MKKNHPNPLNFIALLVFFLLNSAAVYTQNIGINEDGSAPNSKAILDIKSTDKGVLFPRLTSAQREAIVSPPEGLYLYDTDLKSYYMYDGATWHQIEYGIDEAILVETLSDLPTPVGSKITLDPMHTYVFEGVVDISPYYIDLNGAVLGGSSLLHDGVKSSVSGGVLRSTDKNVSFENMIIVPASASTKAFDFSDATGALTCIFHACSVLDVAGVSLGVGNISGFKNVLFLETSCLTTDGVKLDGDIARFVFLNSMTQDMTSGVGIEFLSTANVTDVLISGSTFYNTATAVKMDAGSAVDLGKMNTNILRGVTTPLSGFDSYTSGWEMSLNTDIPNSRSFGYCYMDGNSTYTTFASQGTYTKIQGTTTLVSAKKFSASDNKFTYTGKRGVTCRVYTVIGARAPTSSTDYTIALAKNGTVVAAPTSSLGPLSSSQGFQIVLETEVDLVTNDYIEVFIKSNSGTTSLRVSDFQFRVTE